MELPFLIYGVGAMSRVVSSYIGRSSSILGYTVDDAVISEGQVQFQNAPLYPFSQLQHHVPSNSCRVVVAVGYRDMNALRLNRIKQLQSMGYEVTGYSHPSLLRHQDVFIDETAIVLDYVSIHTGTHIGPHCFLTSQVNIGHDCRVGEGVWINGGVSIGGGAIIGSSSVLSLNATIAHGVELGERVFVGANTLVDRSIESDGVILSASGQMHRLRSNSFLKFSNLQG